MRKNGSIAWSGFLFNHLPKSDRSSLRKPEPGGGSFGIQTEIAGETRFLSSRPPPYPPILPLPLDQNCQELQL